jgi:hypothetical protein
VKRDKKQTPSSPAAGDFLFEIDSRPLEETITALGGVPLLARGGYQLATRPAPAALACAHLSGDQGKENRSQSKRPGAVCKSPRSSDYRASAILPRRSASLKQPRLKPGSCHIAKIAASNAFQILTDGLRWLPHPWAMLYHR